MFVGKKEEVEKKEDNSLELEVAQRDSRKKEKMEMEKMMGMEMIMFWACPCGSVRQLARMQVLASIIRQVPAAINFFQGCGLSAPIPHAVS